jgi:hypothetical protein
MKAIAIRRRKLIRTKNCECRGHALNSIAMFAVYIWNMGNNRLRGELVWQSEDLAAFPLNQRGFFKSLECRDASERKV